MGVVGRKRRTGTTWYAVYQVEGRQVQERVGPDRREAERTLARRWREVAAGVYQDAPATGAITLHAWLSRWLDARTNRSAGTDRSMAKHILGRPWLARRRLDELTPGDMARLVRELAATHLRPRSVRTTWAVLRVALRDAVIAGAISASPCVLPRDLLPRISRQGREAYEPSEVETLTGPKAPPHMRALVAVLFYTGVRIGEAAGLTWGDLLDASPLPAISVSKQYDGRPLKTAREAGEHARLVPVHPALGSILAAWRAEWEAVMCRLPCPEDRLLVNPTGKRADKGWLGQTARLAMQALCGDLRVRWRDVHSTRHTAITWLRRGGARSEVVERITHNARGTILDRYTHWDWAPLCEAMLSLSYGAGYGAAPNLAAKVPLCSGGVPDQAAGNHEKGAESRAACLPADSSNSRHFRAPPPTYDARHTCGPLGWERQQETRHVGRVRRVK